MTPLNLNGIGSCRYIPVILLKFFYEKQLFRLFLKDVKRFYLINQTLQLFSASPLPCYKLFYITGRNFILRRQKEQPLNRILTFPNISRPILIFQSFNSILRKEFS